MRLQPPQDNILRQSESRVQHRLIIHLIFLPQVPIIIPHHLLQHMVKCHPIHIWLTPHQCPCHSGLMPIYLPTCSRTSNLPQWCHWPPPLRCPWATPITHGTKVMPTWTNIKVCSLKPTSLTPSSWSFFISFIMLHHHVSFCDLLLNFEWHSSQRSTVPLCLSNSILHNSDLLVSKATTTTFTCC